MSLDMLVATVGLYAVNHLGIAGYRAYKRAKKYEGRTTFLRSLKRKAFTKRTIGYSILAAASEIGTLYIISCAANDPNTNI